MSGLKGMLIKECAYMGTSEREREREREILRMTQFKGQTWLDGRFGIIICLATFMYQHKNAPCLRFDLYNPLKKF